MKSTCRIIGRGLATCLASFCLIQSAAASVHVSGRIVYSNVDRTEEDAGGGYGEAASIFSRGLSNGQPVAHVRVEVRTKITDILVDWTYTDEDGEFTLVTGGTGFETPGILRVKAANEYAYVKKSKPIPLSTDEIIHADFDINDAYDGGDVELGNVGVDDHEKTFTSHAVSHPVSRALYVAGSVYRGARHIETLTERSLGIVQVRLGSKGTAWYDKFLAVGKTIHLPAETAATIDHEYGHFIEDSIGAFGIIPSYLLTGDHAHSLCSEENECWAFLEGLASWYGAVNTRGFADVSGVRFTGDPVDSTDLGDDPWDYDAIPVLGDNWWVENWVCDATHMAPWTDARAVESVVAKVLWDLIDSHEDSFDALGTGVPEIAEIPIEDVLAVLMETIPSNTPCSWANPYTHPVTLEQFCQVYLDKHAGDGVWPDLYAAYAFNGLAGMGSVVDIEGPQAAALSSTTHGGHLWSNNPHVNITAVDGSDDFSGSFYYFLFPGQYLPTTEFDEGDVIIGNENLRSKATTNSMTIDLESGDDQYVHLQTRDLAGHLGVTSHFGPVRIDLDPPEWIGHEIPAAGEPSLIGKYVRLEWDAVDALSGIDYLRITYSDPANGISGVLPAIIHAASGSYEFYLNPDVVKPSSSAFFSLTMFDIAGNSSTESSTSLDIVSPFDGPFDLDLALSVGRVVSGDLNGDGIDEVVVSGRLLGVPALRIIDASSGFTIQDLAPGLEDGDLCLADTDSDGDLDLVAGGRFDGAAPEIRLFENDGTGSLVPRGALPVPAFDGMVLRVVDLYGGGEPVLVYGGTMGSAASGSELRAYKLIGGGPVELLTGTSFRGGDFEVGDINADGIFDFVTLSVDAYGDGVLAWSLGSDNPNHRREWVAADGIPVLFPELGDVDLGNWDHDNDLDLFVMCRVGSPTGPKDRDKMYEWTGSGFTEVLATARIAEGDGHIVDIYNDGMSDVMAMGRQLSGTVSSWYVTNEAKGRRGTGVPYPVSTRLLYDTDTAWGDFDGDGDLDFVVIGKNSFGGNSTLMYRNQLGDLGKPNHAPPAPRNPSFFYDGDRGGYVFSWDAPSISGDETPVSAFQYEIRVSSAIDGGNVVSWAHHAGHRQQVAAQFVGLHYERFVSMPPIPCEWEVRTVDNGWRRSSPASVIGPGIVIPFPEWVVTYYTPTEILSGLADPMSDSDGDGRSTVMEYFVGKDPTFSDAGSDVTIGRDPVSGMIAISWAQAAEADVNMKLMMSSTLADGTWEVIPAEAVRITEVADPSNPELLDKMAEIDLNLLPPAARRFFRLEVSVDP